MAKGNDGNYLQHSVEVALAIHLAAQHTARRLHIALTHGMAPFEPCGEVPDGQAKRLLHNALCAAQHAPIDAESSIVKAYREVNASLCHYPNTGELLRGVIGQISYLVESQNATSRSTKNYRTPGQAPASYRLGHHGELGSFPVES